LLVQSFLWFIPSLHDPSYESFPFQRALEIRALGLGCLSIHWVQMSLRLKSLSNTRPIINRLILSLFNRLSSDGVIDVPPIIRSLPAIKFSVNIPTPSIRNLVRLFGSGEERSFRGRALGALNRAIDQ
jgi:hypothetical protein